MKSLSRLGALFRDDHIDDDLLRYLVGTLYRERAPLFASIIMGGAITGLAWAMTGESIFLNYLLANMLIGAVRLYLLREYRLGAASGLDRSKTLALDFKFSLWSAIYSAVLGFVCYSLMILPVASGAPPMALGVCAGFTIAYVTRSSGRMRLLLAQAAGTVLPVICACLAHPIPHGSGYALALVALIATTLVLGLSANAKLVELYRANEDNRRMARLDMLTGLRNRYAFSDALSGALAAARENPRDRFAVVSIDLDRFKEINDTLGHLVGDAVIVEMASRLGAVAGPRDLVARMGGDEFVILARGEDGDSDFAVGLAHRAVEALSKPFKSSPLPWPTSASVGVAIYPGHGESAEELMKNADIALYVAKRAGRNQAHVFDREMQTRLRDARLFETEIQRALEGDQFEAWFQPIQNIETGDVVGYEALARWRHPERGLIPPSRFVPAAEESGAIVEIGEIILEKACLAAATWAPHLTIAVNLSPGRFRKPRRLVDAIKTTLLKTGLAPSRLHIEITESLMMDDSPRAREAISELADCGVRFSLDDFGAGYSSLSYIQFYPFSKVKIDKAFIDHIDTDPISAAIVAAICVLASRIQLDVIAEGVETRVQHAALRKLGLTYAQGYLYGRPAPIGVGGKRLQLVASR